MKRDFTLKIYRELLLSLPSGDYSLEGALTNKDQFGIIRHDVDRPPHNVVQLAQLENDLNIKTTYYFRIQKRHFEPKIISRVKELGHEIGYHYEVLDKAKGDVEVAINIFEKEWAFFREWNARTVCMHGNPLSRYDNKDIWKRVDFKKFNVFGEGYLSVDFSKYIYFTDTSRKWNFESCSIKDRANERLIKVKSTSELIKKIKSREIQNIYILTHPSRWNDDVLSWFFELALQSLKNILKKIILRSK